MDHFKLVCLNHIRSLFRVTMDKRSLFWVTMGFVGEKNLAPLVPRLPWNITKIITASINITINNGCWMLVQQQQQWMSCRGRISTGIAAAASLLLILLIVDYWLLMMAMVMMMMLSVGLSVRPATRIFLRFLGSKFHASAMLGSNFAAVFVAVV